MALARLMMVCLSSLWGLVMRGFVVPGGCHSGGWHFVEPAYWPAWRDFELWCGTMADDECEHGKTPAERANNPSVCKCAVVA